MTKKQKEDAQRRTQNHVPNTPGKAFNTSPSYQVLMQKVWGLGFRASYQHVAKLPGADAKGLGFRV
jgi:hypothetical protein